MTIHPDLPISELVLRYPAALPVLAGAGIDTCCGGSETVARAAQGSGLSYEELVARLEAGTAAPGADTSPAPHCGCRTQRD